MSPLPSPRRPGDAPQTHMGAYLLFYLFIYLCIQLQDVTPIFYPPNKVFIKDSGSVWVISVMWKQPIGYSIIKLF